MEENNAAIVIEGITKRFKGRKKPDGTRTVTALDKVDLVVRRAECFALLGPNGAGKSTLMRLLCTLLEPDGGRAAVNGWDVARQGSKVRESIGVMLGGERSSYWKLTGRENLEYFSRLYHIPPRTARARIEEVVRMVELEEKLDERVERYSSGMKQRLNLAKALLNDPPVLLLDEPTLGLDPGSARHIRGFLKGLSTDGGKTIVLATHYMEEADILADRVAIIHEGKIIAQGTPRELKSKVQDATQHAEPTLEDVFLHYTGRTLE